MIYRDQKALGLLWAGQAHLVRKWGVSRETVGSEEEEAEIQAGEGGESGTGIYWP